MTNSDFHRVVYDCIHTVKYATSVDKAESPEDLMSQFWDNLMPMINGDRDYAIKNLIILVRLYKIIKSKSNPAFKDDELVFKTLYKRITWLLLHAKAKEYSNNQDRLIHFYGASNKLGEIYTPEEICLLFGVKHFYSIQMIIEGHDVKEEMIDEKFVDAINYIILYIALLEDKGGNNDRTKN